MEWLMDYLQRSEKYFGKHPFFNALIHACGGIAVGIVIARPFDSGHPLQLAGIFALIAIAGHVIPLLTKKVK